MFTRPDEFADADLVATLAAGWGLDIATLGYLAVGFGSHHWQATTRDQDSWFVTVDDLATKRHEPDEPVELARRRLHAALTTARELADAGYEFVVAPKRTRDGSVASAIGDHYEVAVYPFVPGSTYQYGPYADAAHLNAVLGNLAALHRSPAQCRQWAGTETFAIPRRADLTGCGRSRRTAAGTWFAEPAGHRRRARHHHRFRAGLCPEQR